MSFKDSTHINHSMLFTNYGISDLYNTDERSTDDFDKASRKLIAEEKGLSINSSLSVAKKQKTNHNPMPLTPMKMTSKVHFSQPKENQKNIPSSKDDNPFFNQYIPVKNLQFTHKYQLDGKDHSLLKQLNSYGSGPTALLMLWSDLIRSDASRTISGPFWSWVENCARITCPKNMISRAEIFLNLKLGSQNFDQLKAENVQEPISEINDKPEAKFLAINWFIQESRHSVLAYIQQEGGPHWIVIDQVDLDKRFLTIRDPSQGKPLQISFEKASPWFDDCASNCLWVDEVKQ